MSKKIFCDSCGDEFDYEKRLISYKDNMFFPAFNINTGDKYIFAVNPDNEFIKFSGTSLVSKFVKVSFLRFLKS